MKKSTPVFAFLFVYLFWYSVFIIPGALSMLLQNFCRNDNAPGLVSAVVIITTVCNTSDIEIKKIVPVAAEYIKIWFQIRNGNKTGRWVYGKV